MSNINLDKTCVMCAFPGLRKTSPEASGSLRFCICSPCARYNYVKKVFLPLLNPVLQAAVHSLRAQVFLAFQNCYSVASQLELFAHKQLLLPPLMRFVIHLSFIAQRGTKLLLVLIPKPYAR